MSEDAEGAADVRDEITAEWLRAQDRENTRLAYRRDIDQFFRWCSEQHVDPVQARPGHLRDYRHHLEACRYVQNTVHRKLTVVSSWYRFGTFEFEDLLPVNPMANVRRPKRAIESSTEGLDRDELLALFAAADKLGDWESAFVRMLFYSGARVTELCTATTKDLRRERGHRVMWVTRKGGQRFKVTIGAPAVEALDRHLGGRRGPLFTDRYGKAIDRHGATYRLGLIVKEAQLTKQITPHSLRHTAVTLALDEGVDIRHVQRMVGHTSIETTLRYDRSRNSVDRSPTHALAAALEPGGQTEHDDSTGGM